MKHYRYFTANLIYALSLALLLLVSCGKKDDTPSGTPSDTDSNTVVSGKGTLQMKNAKTIPVFVHAAFNTNSVQIVNYAAIFTGTEERTKDINVSFEVNPSYAQKFNDDYMTAYPILPDSCFELQTSSVIPAGETGTPDLELTLKLDKNIPEDDYLLPVSVTTGDNDITIDESLQVLYFLIKVTNDGPSGDGGNGDNNGNNKSYRLVFADDGLNPQSLYFVGENNGEEMVWKYDLQTKAVVTGYPKKWSDAFDNPYPDDIPKIEAVAWLRYDYDLDKNFDQTLKSYFIGNKSCFTYDFETKEAGSLLALKDLALGTWPAEFSDKLECGFFFEPLANPGDRSNYFFSDEGTFDRQHVGPARGWYPWAQVGDITSQLDLPASFIDRGFSGAYYDDGAKEVRFFSGDECIVLDPNNGFQRKGDVQKIADVYQGL